MGYIVVTFHVHEEDGQYVSLSPELGTASCGASIDEAFQNIAEATIQYLNAIEASGQRERIFRQRKIPIYPGLPPEERRLVLAGNRDFVGSKVLPIAAATGGQRGPVAAMF